MSTMCRSCRRSTEECTVEGSPDCWQTRHEKLTASLDELGEVLERFMRSDGSQFVGELYDAAKATDSNKLFKGVRGAIEEHQRHRNWGTRTAERIIARLWEVLRTGQTQDDGGEQPEVHGFEKELARRLVRSVTSERVHSELSPRERVEQLEQVFVGCLNTACAPGTGGAALQLEYSIRQENLALLLKLARQAVEPVEIMIHCPVCHTKHVDVGEFKTKLHHTHACQGLLEDGSLCGNVWRPAHVPTRGVDALSGFVNAGVRRRSHRIKRKARHGSKA